MEGVLSVIGATNVLIAKNTAISTTGTCFFFGVIGAHGVRIICLAVFE